MCGEWGPSRKGLLVTEPGVLDVLLRCAPLTGPRRSFLPTTILEADPDPELTQIVNFPRRGVGDADSLSLVPE
eukprot:6464421-Prorocentrum_lima.AAC.1